MTGDQIVDRIVAICEASPFSFTEAVSWASFDLQPSQNVDRVFRVLPPASQRQTGRYDYAEDRTDSIQVWLARRVNQDYATVRRTLVRDMHSLTAAVIRDAHQVSGDYSIPDEGRGHAIGEDAGREYAVLRLTLPVMYEAQL